MEKRNKFLEITLEKNQPSEIDLEEMFGFICVTCEPPKNLYHPVLVTWDDTQNKCVATLERIDKQVFTTEEFKVALKLGYKIIKVHRIDNYKKREGLWNDFIKDLYIEKLANSGPPPDNQEERERIVNGYEEAFGMGEEVNNSFSRWKYDGAMRSVYKTLLNCGWGKHCEQPNKATDTFVHEMGEMDDIIQNIQGGGIKVKKITPLVGGHTRVRTENIGGKKVNTHNTYIPAGCYVPAYGRLTLFEYLHKLGERVLYHDTDSIIYLYDPSKENIPENDLWGDWDEEKISKKGIDAFCSLGPKTYAIRAGDEEIVKIKGVSIKHSHSDIINFDVMSKFIDDHLLGNYEKVSVPQLSFDYTMGKGIVIRHFLKLLKFDPQNLKGDLRGLLVYPKGFIHNQPNS